MNFFFVIIFLLGLSHANAFTWMDLWQTSDQQGQKLMEAQKFHQAEKKFVQAKWRAAAAYRAGDYAKAAKIYAKIPDESGYYNYGNALMHLQQYAQAINAYNKTLAVNPTNKNAIYNRSLAKKLLKKQQQAKKGKSNQPKNNDNKNKQSQQQQKQQKSERQANNSEQENNNGNQQPGDEQQMDGQQKNGQQNVQSRQESVENQSPVKNRLANKNEQASQEIKENIKQQDLKDNKGAEQPPKQQELPQNNQEQQQSSRNHQEQYQQNIANDNDPSKQEGQGLAQQSVQENEKQQAKAQWLKLIPDDPGGLMRAKFWRDHLRRQNGWRP